MLRITVQIPTHKINNFTVSYGHGIRNKKTAMKVYNDIERKIKKLSHSPASRLKEKTAVHVKYGGRYHNEAESDEANPILYATACFLEDFISKETLEKKYKIYQELKKYL